MNSLIYRKIYLIWSARVWAINGRFRLKEASRTTIHSMTQEAFDAHILHSSKDKFSAIRLDDYYQSYSLLAAFISYLDQVPRPSTPVTHR